MLLASNPGDVVLDVFGGSGSTFHAAQLHGRKWIGCEIGDVTTILKRLETIFKLNPKETLDNRLKTCFKRGFMNREFILQLQDHRFTQLNGTEPFNNKSDSFQESASKSRVILSNESRGGQ